MLDSFSNTAQDVSSGVKSAIFLPKDDDKSILIIAFLYQYLLSIAHLYFAEWNGSGKIHDYNYQKLPLKCKEPGVKEGNSATKTLHELKYCKSCRRIVFESSPKNWSDLKMLWYLYSQCKTGKKVITKESFTCEKQDQKSIDAIGLVFRLYSTLYRYISFIYTILKFRAIQSHSGHFDDFCFGWLICLSCTHSFTTNNSVDSSTIQYITVQIRFFTEMQ